MNISVFYENIHDGALAAGLQTEDVLRRLRDAGMDSIYISADSWKRDRTMLKESLKKLGLRTGGMHAFCDFPGEKDAAPYREIIDLAAESGADNLLFVPGMLSTGNTLRDLEQMTEGMKRAQSYGCSVGMPVLMEDYDGLLAPYNCIAGLKYFLDSVEGLGCAFDTGNFAMFHEDELAAFDLFAGKIRTVHLKDRSLSPRHEGDTACLCADGEKVYACAVGSGYIHMDEILRRLRNMDFHGNVIVELYACDPRYFLQDALDSLRWVREQLKD